MKYSLLLILSLTVLSSCSWSEIMKKDAPEATLTGQQVVSYEAELDSISEKIKKTPEFGTCLSQNINMCSQSVGMELAQKEKSTEFCKELKGQEEQNSCAFAVTLINA